MPDAVGSTVGSAHVALDVPDFTKGPLAVSGLLLASKAEGQRPTSGEDADWKNRFDVPPTTVRAFAKDDEITVLDEIYNNEANAPVEATTTVVDEKDREVFRRSETLDAGTHPGRVTIPLRDFGAGNYLLKVEAKSRTNAKAVVSREIVFAVR